MNKTPNFDSKLKAILDATKPGERVCSLTGETWELTRDQLDRFHELGVPVPDIAPKTLIRRLAGFATGVAIWRNKDAQTGKDIYSYIHPDHFIKPIDDKTWMNTEFLYEKELDTSRPFFDQLEERLREVPLGALLDEGSSPNSFGVEPVKSQNCYMVFFTFKSKNLFNAMNGVESEECFDVTNTFHSRESSMVNRGFRLYKCRYAMECVDCLESTFIFDCRNCEYCFGATNKRNARYLFFNEQLSKSEWEKRVAEIDLGSRGIFDAYKAKFNKLMEEDTVWPENFNNNSFGSTGDYLFDCVESQHCFFEQGNKRCYWDYMGDRNEGNYGVMWSDDAHWSYACNGLLQSQKMIACHFCWYNHHLEYCFFCFHCEYCFGCVGLKRKRFCIFNKQYTEEGYWKKLDEIKSAMLDYGEYGRFFPSCFSPMGYQFSLGELYDGYTHDDLKEFDAPVFDARVGSIVDPGENTLSIEDLPDRVEDRSVVGKPIYDERLKRLYQVTEGEWKHLSTYRLPFPNEHVFRRLQRQIQFCNSYFSRESACAKCQKTILVHENKTFAKRLVYCKNCYLAYLEVNG